MGQRARQSALQGTLAPELGMQALPHAPVLDPSSYVPASANEPCQLRL